MNRYLGGLTVCHALEFPHAAAHLTASAPAVSAPAVSAPAVSAPAVSEVGPVTGGSWAQASETSRPFSPRHQGAGATRVDHETQLDDALGEALAADGPFLVDVRIDPRSLAPASQRNAALAAKPAAHRERVFPSAGEPR